MISSKMLGRLSNLIIIIHGLKIVKFILALGFVGIHLHCQKAACKKAKIHKMKRF